MPTVKLGTDGAVRVSLPAEVTRKLKIRRGAALEVLFLDDGIFLFPAGRIPKGQRYFWTREWQAKEIEAEADLAAGRVHGPFGTAADAITFLRGKPV